MFKVISHGSVSDGNAKKIIADNLSDLPLLPKQGDGAGVGSQCVVLEDSNLYVLGNDDDWHLFGGVREP